jgi:choline monooxygenase
MARAELSSLEPSAYYSVDRFYRELSSVFFSNWLCAGTVHELKNTGDWKTVSYGNHSWIVTNTKSGIRCFKNVCSHRHSRICTIDRGNGPLRCGYHGWTYDDAGYPVGLPGHRDNFDLTIDERQQLKLLESEVTLVGSFVFFRDKNTGPRLESAFECDSLVNLLKTVEICSDLFQDGEFLWKANWKTAVENTLEPYHVGFVHSETLMQVVEPGPTGYRVQNSSAHSHRLRDSSRQWWQKMTKSAGILPSPSLSDYWHFHIHPNLCIGVTYGTLLSVQIFEPVTAEETRLRFQLYMPNSSEGDGQASLRLALQRFLTDYNNQVLNEDRGPVEACQNGYRDAQRKAIFGESESRITHFHKLLQQDLSNSRDAFSTKDQR